MAQSIFSDAQIRAARPKPGQDRSDYSVDGVPGLRLRVTANGAKTFRLESRKTGKVTLGSYPTITLSDARSAALNLIGEAERHRVNDQTGTKVLRTADRRTLQDILDAYGKARGAAVASWPDQLAAITYRYGQRLDVPTAKLTSEIIRKPVETERNVAAKRAARYLSTVLRWAETGQPVPNAVLDDLVPETPDDRVLMDDELRRVLIAADDLGPVWRDFTRALVYTMARRKDLAEMMGDHVDLGARIWHARIHKTRGRGTKTEAHPLSDQTLALLRPRSATGKPVFATTAGQPLRNNFDRTLKRLHRLSDTSDWSWHDLRRTARTIMGRSGVRPDIAERCMSHSPAGASRMSAVYDRYDYADDMRAAYQSLAEAVDGIVRHD